MHRLPRSSLIFGACALGTCAALAPALPGAAQATSITIDSSTTFTPLLSDVAQVYHTDHPEVLVRVANLGSRAGANAVEKRDADVAFVDTAPAPPSALVAQAVFAVPLAVVANPQLGITNLTRAQVAALFTGGYTSWKELNGPDMPVKPLTRPVQSAMSLAFSNTFGVAPSSGDVVATSQEATDAVRATPGGVCFVTLDVAKAAGLRPVLLDGHDPAGGLGTLAYPFFAIGYAVTSGPPSTELSRFLAFLTTRRALLSKYGIVSTRDLIK